MDVSSIAMTFGKPTTICGMEFQTIILTVKENKKQ